MKFTFLLLLVLNFMVISPVFGGPGGGSTTPFPLGLDPAELVGSWVNPQLGYSLTIQHIAPAKGQNEKLFVVLSQANNLSRGFMYFTGTQYCGILYSSTGSSMPLCLKGRYGLLSLDSDRSRLYFSQVRTPLKR